MEGVKGKINLTISLGNFSALKRFMPLVMAECIKREERMISLNLEDRTQLH